MSKQDDRAQKILEWLQCLQGWKESGKSLATYAKECLFAKRLERDRFIWPQATHGAVILTAAQLSMLLEGIDWRRPVRTVEPQLSV